MRPIECLPYLKAMRNAVTVVTIGQVKMPLSRRDETDGTKAYVKSFRSDIYKGKQMAKVLAWALSVAAVMIGTPALAQDEPRFCPTRPNLGGSSCTTEPGRVHVEMSALDWERDEQSDQREDRIVTADILTRLGVGKNTELQLEWVGYGRDRTRDKANETVDTVTGTGDVTFAIREHLAGQKGMPFRRAYRPSSRPQPDAIRSGLAPGRRGHRPHPI